MPIFSQILQTGFSYDNAIGAMSFILMCLPKDKTEGNYGLFEFWHIVPRILSLKIFWWENGFWWKNAILQYQMHTTSQLDSLQV
jgi:hypothetical protein